MSCERWKCEPHEPANFTLPHIICYVAKQVVTKIVKLFVTLTILLNTTNPPIGILNSFIAFVLWFFFLRRLYYEFKIDIFY